MEVVKNYYHRKVSTIVISTALFSQIGKVLLHILKEKKEEPSKTEGAQLTPSQLRSFH